ncbi:MAG: SDR family oxidoreductase [Archangium sp.]|nr:SDR family oxidoreductase [Archangium sp.]
MPPLLVTGASGQLGRRVLELLLESKAGPIVAATRTPVKLESFAKRGVDVRQADFDNAAAFSAALKGVERVLLISTDAVDRPGRRLEQHKKAIELIRASGTVKHVVYTSLANPHPKSPISIANDHRETEAALKASGLGFTALRNTMYVDLAVPTYAGAVKQGQLVDARGQGRVSLITREDCARAAAAALASTFEGTRTLEVTGPQALSSADVAALLAEVTEKPVTHVPLEPAALKVGMVQHGLPPPVADLLVSFDVAIAQGDLAHVSRAVEELTGQPAQSMRDFFKANRAALTGA